MYYIFKKDIWGNHVPYFAAQTNNSATHYANGMRDDAVFLHVQGNTKTLMGI